MTGLRMLKQKWTMLNTERLTAEKCIKEIKEQLKYQQDKAKRIQGDMDKLMVEIKKLKE